MDATTPTRTSTKPYHWSWMYFTRVNVEKEGKKLVYAKCNYCPYQIATHVDRMATHLSLVSFCEVIFAIVILARVIFYILYVVFSAKRRRRR